MRRLLLILASIIIGIICAGCLDDVSEAPFEIPDAGLGAPQAVAAEAGNGSVALTWRSVDGAEAYRVYRSTDPAAAMERIAETSDTGYVDAAVRNGTRYLYRVAARGSSGLEGPRSETIAITPALYSVLINGGQTYTGSSIVSLGLTAPATTEHMMISSSPALEGAVWEAYVPTRTFELEGADGELFVYARFRDAAGSLSPIVSDGILKDTYARIQAIEFHPDARLYAPGSTVHVIMRVEDDERGGRGRLSFGGLAEVDLLDDGRGGDETAEDGVYEAQYRFPSALRGVDVPVTALFLDRAGNEAPQFDAGGVSFTDPPAAVQLLGVADSSRTSITIKWVASADGHFASYRIYRGTSSGVTESPANLVRELFNAAQTSYPDGQLMEGQRYYYRIFVVNDLGETAGSNEIVARTYDGYPTEPLLDEPSAVGPTRATLTWSVNPDTDFREYRLYRATAPGVTNASTLVATIAVREITFYDDTGIDTSANSYYYRVYGYDLGGKYTRSNEVSTAQ